jgi:hypothetical protein
MLDLDVPPEAEAGIVGVADAVRRKAGKATIGKYSMVAFTPLRWITVTGQL